MKDLAKYIPGMGWMFMFMEYPVIKRNWNEDQRTLAASCRNLADYPVNMLVSVVSLCGFHLSVSLNSFIDSSID